MSSEENLGLFSLEDLPQTDEVKEKVKVNNLQENLAFLMNKRKVELAEVQRETSIPWGTLHSWATSSVNCQMLDLNVKELADFFDIEVGRLAFGDLAKEELEKD
jgi:hypothetical protein